MQANNLTLLKQSNKNYPKEDSYLFAQLNAGGDFFRNIKIQYRKKGK